MKLIPSDVFLVIVLLVSPIHTCTFKQVDLSSYAKLKYVGPKVTLQPKDQMSCILECGRSQACIAAAWNIKKSECGLINQSPNLDSFNTEEFPLENPWDFFLKEEFACTNGGKISTIFFTNVSIFIAVQILSLRELC